MTDDLWKKTHQEMAKRRTMACIRFADVTVLKCAYTARSYGWQTLTFLFNVHVCSLFDLVYWWFDYTITIEHNFASRSIFFSLARFNPLRAH